ncbi:hypothetical protein [Ruegeria sp. HKCCD6109]|uniref:hypothetical protein n=1 Tax=Ruegeria sp. HKCCD6109 TaxID=2683017 RepID=UPI001491548D|nr:hypothetical protein [Ruegeria sp. HKCCD6109]NOD65741.1 hypothetical protein [Ruegeria sp. HKCCD6109]
MKLNSGIILAGRPVNAVNALSQGMQLASSENDMRHRNELMPFELQSAEQGIQMNALNMDATRQRMEMARRADARASASAGRASANHQRALEAQEAQQRVRNAIQMIDSAQTPEQWDQLASQHDPSLVGQFGNKRALLGRLMPLEQRLQMEIEAQQPPEMTTAMNTLTQRAQQAGLQPGTPEFQAFMLNGGPPKGGERISFDENGNPVIERGAAVNATPPKMTVDAAKNTGFLIRTRDANEVLNELEDEGTRFAQQNLESVPLGIGNYFRDQDFQRFDQARRDFVNSILRRESGAVIADSEFDNANKQYFPVPGDGPDVIAQKRQNRENAIRGLEVGSGGGAAFLDSQQSQSENPFVGMTDEQFNQIRIDELTSEQINQLYEARGLE